jgi:MFS family permease
VLLAERDPRYGWVIVGALGVTETVSYGVLGYAFSVVLVPMQQATGWSRPALTGAYSLAVLVWGAASVWVGRALDRRSPRLLMSAGSALAGALVFAWSRATSLLELYLVFVGLGVAMALVLYEAAFIVVTKWFRYRRGAALTVVTLIAALASFIFSPLTERLVAAYGWRDAVAVLALILVGTTLPLHLLVLRPAPAAQADPTPTAPHSPRTLARSGAFWLIVAAFVLASFAGSAIAVHLVALLVSDGRSAAFAAFAAGLMGLAQIPGRLVFGTLGGRLGATRVPVGVFALAAAALVLLMLERSTWAVLVFVLGFGMSGGMTTLLRATLVADLYGRERFGSISGLVSGFVLAARAAGPFGAALVVLLPGGYTTLLGVLALAGAAATWSVALGVRRAGLEGTSVAHAVAALVDEPA